MRRQSSKSKDKNYNNKGKGTTTRRRNTNRGCDQKTGVDYGESRSQTNDVKWYEQTPELLRDAASLPFSQASGTTFNRGIEWKDIIGNAGKDTIPGLMTLSVVPIIGDATVTEKPRATSPLNIASMAMYSFVRHANSGSPNYSAPNLTMYCMAVAQIYSYINYLQRVYGLVNLYSHYNRYLPKSLEEAQFVDFEDLISNLADFRYGVNSLIAKAASFACPSDQTYFQRLAFLFSGIYAEGESIKDQLYMYVPEAFLMLSEINDTPGWRLNAVQFRNAGSGKNNTHLVADLIEYGNDLIQPLLMSEDINIMSGDILKAYGRDGILSMQTLPEVYNILPTTDLTVLEQFQNADWVSQGGVDGTSNPGHFACGVVEKPSTNLIASYAGFNTSVLNEQAVAATLVGDHLLTTILTDPTPGDVIERTRMMVHGLLEAGDTVADDICNVYSGSEICNKCYLHKINPINGELNTVEIQRAVVLRPTTTELQMQTMLNVHCMLENFKFHPTVYYFTATAEGTATFFNTAVDVDNYTLISPDTLVKMNEAALLSLFRVTSVARFQ